MDSGYNSSGPRVSGGRRLLEHDIVPGKLFLGGLDSDITKEALEHYCSSWGQVADTFVSPKGFGFVTFANVEEAFQFLEHEPHTINERDVEVKAAMPKSRGGGQRPTNKLFVGGVPREVTSDDFRQHFSRYGNIEDAAIVADQNGVSRGFGFVTYDNTKSIEKALIVRHHFGDRIVDCKRAVPKEELRGQGTWSGATGPSMTAVAPRSRAANRAAEDADLPGQQRNYPSGMASSGGYGYGPVYSQQRDASGSFQGMSPYAVGGYGYAMGGYGMGVYNGYSYGVGGYGVGAYGLANSAMGGGYGRNNGRPDGRQTRYQPY